MEDGYFASLKGQQFMSLTTFRKSGKAVATPVWFVDVGGKLYMTTQSSAGKVKRIRNNGAVTVAPCTYSGELRGPTVEAHARILPETDFPEARTALQRKYGFQMTIARLFQRFQRQRTGDIYLEITPVNGQE